MVRENVIRFFFKKWILTSTLKGPVWRYFELSFNRIDKSEMYIRTFHINKSGKKNTNKENQLYETFLFMLESNISCIVF